jgi:beta-glucosidase
MKHKEKLILCLAAGLLTTNMMAQNAPKLNANNIDEVVKAMTLEEKASLLIGATSQAETSGAMVGATKKLVAGAAGTTTAIPRLGIPATVLTDGPAGVRIDPTRKGETKTYYATGFPIGTALACTWNTPLVEQVGKAIGNEVLEYGCDVILGPGMNIHRNPLCGRNFEYYSEDPILCGKIAAAYVRGVQSQGVGTSIKHFAVNSQETNRTGVDERVSQRALREIYLRGFEIAVRESQPWTVMSSYNKINGTLTQESRDLLTDVLRSDWGFKGMVMTDWTGLRNTAAQIHAGNDLMEPGYTSQVKDIINKVKSGELSESDMDVCIKRILQYIVRTPHFKGYQYSDTPDLKAHAAITRQSATEGMVLLKNAQGVLPLETSKVKNVALFGVNSYDFFSGGTGSGCVHTPYVVDMVKGLKDNGIGTTKTLTDIYQKYIDYAKVKFQADADPVMWFLKFGQPKMPEIEISKRCIDADVKDADAAIITIGRQAGEGIDRSIDEEFNLTTLERDMIKNVSGAFHLAGKPVIVIVNSGSVIETASWRDGVDAILVAWQPGEEGGNSVADVLTGKANPSGKLSMTWPIAATDHPSTKNFPGEMSLYDYREMKGWGAPIQNIDATNHEEDIYVGYRYFDTFGKNVSYPFGFGLSYTKFEYGKPSVSQKGDAITVSVNIKNIGNRAGKEVAEVYVTAPKGKIEKPAKELKTFGKTRELKPGESETLKMTFQKRDLASFDEAQSQWAVDAGTYTVKVGANVEDIHSTTPLKVSAYTEKVSNSLKPQQALNLLKQ